jgi:CRISPR-associated helicase Cas3/CRISPR-associated endonuclease Cas3-HD
MNYIAHRRESDGKEQTVAEHLEGVACYSRQFASKLGLEDIGELLGLLHDLGKYSSEFQNYIKSATGILNPDEDEYVNAKGLKGKIDHSTAGAQLLWQSFPEKSAQIQLFAKILSLCLVSHHSGLIDCLSPEGKPVFNNRIKKQTHEISSKIDNIIKNQINKLLSDPSLIQSLLTIMTKLKPKNINKKIHLYKIGLLIRFLYSCLIDADRTDSCIFERPYTKYDLLKDKINWNILIERLEAKLEDYKQNPNPKPIDLLRAQISEQCKTVSKRKQQIFTLTVPTGGGKTLSSLRFALYHAKEHKLDRIIYVVPFTTIIDQNADEVRKILEPNSSPYSSIVLEHHSNLTPNEETFRNKVLSENWNAPIIFTTSVQLLEVLFGGGTRGARRMHQLANSLIIFDEIQTLPIRCVHMFNNAINFLVDICHSSIILCTATQPLLNKVDVEKGTCSFNKESEIIADVKKLFEDLKRVDVLDRRKIEGCSDEEIAKYAITETKDSGNCLIVTNTKKNALRLYKKLSLLTTTLLYHLSTDMCPAHRRATLSKIQKNLADKTPLICVSTQLIEAGIDIDFGSVIRCIAGIDSIAQAAGRCNRHGFKKTGHVLIVNNKDENLSKLPDIKKGKEAAERILDELKKEPDNDILAPSVLERFFTYYFFNRKKDMDYPISEKSWLGREDHLLDLLSDNEKTIAEYRRINKKYPEDNILNQSFLTAGKIFKAIDAPTCGVVVPYEQEGKEIIGLLGASFDLEKQFKLLKRAQQYSVNLYPWKFDELCKKGAIKEVQKDSGVYFLEAQYYDKNFGINNEPVNIQETLIV